MSSGPEPSVLDEDPMEGSSAAFNYETSVTTRRNDDAGPSAMGAVEGQGRTRTNRY